MFTPCWLLSLFITITIQHPTVSPARERNRNQWVHFEHFTHLLYLVLLVTIEWIVQTIYLLKSCIKMHSSQARLVQIYLCSKYWQAQGQVPVQSYIKHRPNQKREMEYTWVFKLNQAKVEHYQGYGGYWTARGRTQGSPPCS